MNSRVNKIKERHDFAESTMGWHEGDEPTSLAQETHNDVTYLLSVLDGLNADLDEFQAWLRQGGLVSSANKLATIRSMEQRCGK